MPKNIPEHTLTKCILCFWRVHGELAPCTRAGGLRLVVVALMGGAVAFIVGKFCQSAMWVCGSETSFFTTGGQQSQARNRCSLHGREQSR